MRLPPLQGHCAPNFMTYQHQCTVPGCTAVARARYSTLCPRHRSVQHRHGHPEQTAITVSELRPFRRQVAERRKANPSSPAWRILEERWARVLAHCRETLRIWESGRACIRWHVQAAKHLLAIADAVPPGDVVETALALVILAARQPHRFSSDRAFDHQMVRRVRGLAETSSGSYWNPKTQRVHKVYRDLPPRTVQAIAHQLRGSFYAAGLQLAELEQAQAEAAATESRQLERALMAMR